MKRSVSIALTLPILAGCATTADPDKPVVAACAGVQCFRERDIRDIEFLDDHTLVAFVGPNRCAYRMELDGTYCGYGFGPMIDFVPASGSRRILAGSPREELICLSDRPYVRDPLTDPGAMLGTDIGGGSQRGPSGVPSVGDLRGAAGRGPLGSNAPERIDQCRVAAITPLSDDELLEVYSEAGAQSPLPPVGSGQVSVPEDQSASEDSADQQTPGTQTTGPNPQQSAEPTATPPSTQ